MLSIKKNIVTAIIQTKLTTSSIAVLNPRNGWRFPETRTLVIFTIWVKGRTASAVPCAAIGKDVMGKNVPVKKNIGVKNKKVGKLKKSILGANAVKHIAMEPNINPPKKANGTTNKNNGFEIKPKAAITAKTIVALKVDRVAPHRSSPVTTSSTLTGVATIASKVFW